MVQFTYAYMCYTILASLPVCQQTSSIVFLIKFHMQTHQCFYSGSNSVVQDSTKETKTMRKTTKKYGLKRKLCCLGVFENCTLHWRIAWVVNISYGWYADRFKSILWRDPSLCNTSFCWRLHQGSFSSLFLIRKVLINGIKKKMEKVV